MQYFRRLGIETLRDALHYFPFRYEDRRKVFRPKELATVPEGSLVSVAARVVDVREKPGKLGKRLIELRAVGVDGGELTCTWFHAYKGMMAHLMGFSEAVFTGQLKIFRGRAQLIHPDVARSDGGSSLHWGRIVPIYSTTEGLSQKYLRETIAKALELGLPLVEEELPAPLRARLGLVDLKQAIREMHFPAELPRFDVESATDVPPAFYRLIFEEFFKYQILRLHDARHKVKEKAPALEIKNRTVARIRKNLPFTLTNGQEAAIAEIRADIRETQPMNRILQGDVGSGKTLVAFMSLAEAVDNGRQGVLMVPTETLAEQHFKGAEKVFANTGVRIALLTGSQSAKEKRAAQAAIAKGEIDLVIGTHALIQESVEWNDLALIVIDEQQRFGVRQRARLRSPGKRNEVPHLLTMTATPIPRSLALTVFGDLHVSSLREMPKDRLPIKTKALHGSERQKVYNLFVREARAGRQGYLIYPLVQDSEKEGMERLKSVVAEYERLKNGPLASLRLGMLHGQMPAEERQLLMQAFARHELDVLISTTVIEVGIDVPNATVIAIEHAERFGLAQLHQLRGRVGRGAHQSYCVLVTDIPRNTAAAEPRLLFSDEAGDEGAAWARLEVLEKSTDGFAIAEADLKFRGPGDFLGTKQSGAPAFRLANLERDRATFELARDEADSILRTDPRLDSPQNTGLRTFLFRAHAELGFTLKSG